MVLLQRHNATSTVTLHVAQQSAYCCEQSFGLYPHCQETVTDGLPAPGPGPGPPRPGQARGAAGPPRWAACGPGKKEKKGLFEDAIRERLQICFSLAAKQGGLTESARMRSEKAAAQDRQAVGPPWRCVAALWLLRKPFVARRARRRKPFARRPEGGTSTFFSDQTVKVWFVRLYWFVKHHPLQF